MSPGMDRGMPNGELLGIVLAMLGGILDNVGVSLQKLSLNAIDQELRPSYWTNRNWVLGLCMYLTGTVLNGIGLGLAPASMVALLAPFVLVYNVINSVLVLKERLTKTILIGTVIIIVGSSVAIATGSGSREPDLFRVEDFVAYLTTPAFLIYSICLISFMMILLIGVIRRDYLDSQALSDIEQLAFNDRSSDLHNISDRNQSRQHSFGYRARNLLTDSWRRSSWSISPKIAFPVFAGCLASLTTLTWKCSIELIKSSIQGYPAFRYLWTYILLLSVVVFGAGQVYMLNMSMRYSNQLFLIPTLVVTNELLSILGGCIFLNEMAGFTMTQALEFIAAIVVIMSGIYLVSTGQAGDDTGLLQDDILEIAAKKHITANLICSRDDNIEGKKMTPLMFEIPLTD